MPIKIPQLPTLPEGLVTGQVSIPVAKTTSDPKTYKVTLDQTLAWVLANGGGGGSQGPQGFQGPPGSTGTSGYQGTPGVIGASGYSGVQGTQGTPGVQGASGYQGVQGTQGTPGVQGASGYQGVQGTQGSPGVEGASGYQGAQGTQGTPGVQGASGYQGVQGTQGTPGVEGASGYQGVQGTQGSPGVQGASGYQGVQGTQGTPGISGFSGYQGVQGTQGSPGVEGASGYQGIQGTQGTPGISGFSGYQGVQGTPGEAGGVSGYSGYQGVQGTQGSPGVEGASGYQGVQGTQGSPGVEGASGYQGVQGPQGTQGTQGVIGASGYQGYQGVQGTQGSPGVEGASGYQGVQGTQGTQGVAGASGYQGFEGPQGFSGYQGYSGYQGLTGESGYQGVQGTSGYQGAMGSSTGQPGPGLVYTGEYRNTSYTYFNTLVRKDVVSYDGTYYLANSTTLTATSGASGWQVPGAVAEEWSNFGQEFASVATGLLLTEDATITKNLVLGEVGNLSAGIIRTANCDNFFDGQGFWLGNDANGRQGVFIGNSNGPSYLLYDSNVGVVELSGTIFATAGSIGGVGISEGIIYTGSPSGAGTSATPLYISSASSYSPGEIIFSLGNKFIFAADPTNSSQTVLLLSGGITANSGSIGGIGITTYNGGSVLYSGSPSGAGTSATPIFINGRAAGTYSNGEVIFGLGDGLVYYYDTTSGTYIAQLSGVIRANAGSIGGVGINQGYIWSGGVSGVGYFQNDNTPFWLNGDPDPTNDNYFSLGGNLVYYKTGGVPVLAVSGTITAEAGSIGGVGIKEGYIWSGGSAGSGFFANDNTPFWVNGNPDPTNDNYFSLGSNLVYYKVGGIPVLAVSGTITAEAGSIGGVGITQGYIWSGGSAGSGFFANDNTPFWLNGDPDPTNDNYFSLGSNLVYYKTGGVPVLAVSGTITAEQGSIGGVGIKQGYIWSGGSAGSGFFANDNTPFWVNGDPDPTTDNYFSLGSNLVYYKTSGIPVLAVSGTITAEAGSIGGVGINQGYIWSGGSGGIGYFGNDNTPFWVNGDPDPTTDNYFSLGSNLVYYKTGGVPVLAVSGTITAEAGSIGGVGITQGYIWSGGASGVGYFANDNTPFWVNGSPDPVNDNYFSLGGNLVYYKTGGVPVLAVSGTITAEAGSIGGVGITQGYIWSGGASGVGYFGNDNTPFWLNGSPDPVNDNYFSLGSNLVYYKTGGVPVLAVSGTITAEQGSIGGIGIKEGYIWSGGSAGSGFFANDNTPFWVNGSPDPTTDNYFSLGSNLVYYKTGGVPVLAVSGTITAEAGSIGGVGINQGYIWSGGASGVGYFQNDNTPFWLNGNPDPTTDNYFSLGSNLVYYKTGGVPVLAVSGTITAEAGSIGGVGITQGYIWSGGSAGSGFFANDNTPFWLNGNPDPTTDNYFSLGSNLVYYKTGGIPVLAVSGTITAEAGSIGGVGINQGYIWSGGASGIGYFQNDNTPFWVNGNPDPTNDNYFSLGSNLVYYKTGGVPVLAVSGTITAEAGSIGGVGINQGYIWSGGASGIGYFGNDNTPFWVNGNPDPSTDNYFSLGSNLVYYKTSGIPVLAVSGTITAEAGSIGGVGISQGFIWSGGASGIGYFANDNTPFWVNGSPDPYEDNYFSLGSNLVYYKLSGTPVLAVSGTITAEQGSIGGVGISQGFIWSGGSGGIGYFANDNTPFWVNGSPDPYEDNYFSLGSNLVYYKLSGTPVLAISGTITAEQGSIGGVGISQGFIWSGGSGGIGYFANDNTPFWVNGSPDPTTDNYFSLGSNLVYYKTSGTPVLAISGTITAEAGSIGGVGINQGYIWSGGSGGIGYFANDNTPFWVNGSPDPTTDNYFSLGSNLVYYKTGGVPVLAVSGTITAEAGSIGGVGIKQGYIWTGGSGGQGYYANSNTPFYVNSQNYRFSIGDALYFDGSALTVNGTINVSGGNAATQTYVNNTVSDINARIYTDQAGRLVTSVGESPSATGLYLGSDKMGYYRTTSPVGWRTYMDNTGNFYLNGTGSNSLLWDGSALTITGNISATSGLYAGNGTNYISWNTGTGKLTVKGIESVDGVYVTSSIGMRYINDQGVFTITGGDNNNARNGAQIDLAGTDRDSEAGALVLQAGDPVTTYSKSSSAANINFRTGPVGTGPLSGTAKIRAVLYYDGTFAISGPGLDHATLSLSGNYVGSNSYGDRFIHNYAPTTEGKNGDIWYGVS